MSYIKAADILPQELIDQLQQYVDGKCIYIPRKESNRKSWGENTQYKETLQARNKEIYRKYREGTSVFSLADQYYLSPKTIQKILARMRG